MFGKKEKQVTDELDEQVKRVMGIRFLDSNIDPMGRVIYSFVIIYKDNRREILEAAADDPLLQALLPKEI